MFLINRNFIIYIKYINIYKSIYRFYTIQPLIYILHMKVVVQRLINKYKNESLFTQSFLYLKIGVTESFHQNIIF